MRSAIAILTLAGCSAEFSPPSQQPPDAAPLVDAAVDAGLPACPPEWWDCEYTARQALTIDNAAGPELANVPVLVVLDGTRAETGLLTPDNIRFVDGQGNVLAHEVDAELAGGGLAAWVLLPTLGEGASSVIHAYYGNATAVAAADAATVWTGYAGVWHLGGNPQSAAPQMEDSTGNGNAGTANGDMGANSRVIGRIGDAITFDGVDDFISVANSESVDITGTSLTLSAWFRLTNTPVADTGLLVKSLFDDVNGSVYHYHLGVEADQVGNFRVTTDQATTPLSRIDSTTMPAVGTWYHVAGVYDGTATTIYINGVAETTLAHTGAILSTTEPLLMGRRALGDERYFDGSIDEARITSKAQSAAWIAFQYRTGADTAISYGAVEQHAGPDA